MYVTRVSPYSDLPTFTSMSNNPNNHSDACHHSPRWRQSSRKSLPMRQSKNSVPIKTMFSSKKTWNVRRSSWQSIGASDVDCHLNLCIQPVPKAAPSSLSLSSSEPISSNLLQIATASVMLYWKPRLQGWMTSSKGFSTLRIR